MGLRENEVLEGGMTFEYDPTGPDFQRDPLSAFKVLRDEHPAYYNERLRFWALTRWEDVWNAASDFETFASDPAHYGELDHEPTELMPRWMMDFGIFYLDPPRHDRMRNLLARTFTPRRVCTWSGRSGRSGKRRSGKRRPIRPARSVARTITHAAMAGRVRSITRARRSSGRRLEETDDYEFIVVPGPSHFYLQAAIREPGLSR